MWFASSVDDDEEKFRPGDGVDVFRTARKDEVTTLERTDRSLNRLWIVKFSR